MSAKALFQHLEVAVAVIVDDGRILAVYNPKWGAYCLPMTKRHSWADPQAPHGMRLEEWPDAAIRARTEAVLGTITNEPVFVLDIPEFQQSDRDGTWKRYHFQVFKFSYDAQQLAPGANVEWLTPEELLDEHRRPISKTTRDVIAKVKVEAGLNGEAFP